MIDRITPRRIEIAVVSPVSSRHVRSAGGALAQIDFGQAAQQETPLRFVGDQRERMVIGLTRLVPAAQAPQEIRTRRP